MLTKVSLVRYLIMSEDCISIYTTLWAYNIYSAMSRDEFCKELDLLCKVRDSYINGLPNSLVLEYLDNVYIDYDGRSG